MKESNIFMRRLALVLVIIFVFGAAAACGTNENGNNFVVDSEDKNNDIQTENEEDIVSVEKDNETEEEEETEKEDADAKLDVTKEENEVDSGEETVPTETPTPIPVEPPHEHSYAEVEGSVVEATCTTDGKKADKVCECGDKVEGEVVKATGHNYGSYKSDGNATYDADGTKTAECSVCGAKDTVTDAGSKLERLKYTYTDMNKTMYAKSSVNVRDLPSTDGNKLGGLSSGQEVTVTGKCNETGWFRVDYNGKVAYVSNSYLQDNKPVEETPTPTPTTPSGYPAILNTEDGWYLREDGVYQSPASWEYSSTNIGSEWIGKTIAEYCAAQGTSGVTFTDPWYCTRFMNVDRWGDYVIGSRKLTTVTYEGCTVDVKIPF